MKLPKLIWKITAIIGGLFLPLFAAASPWDQPASKLAARIADILGPGQATLTIQNLSSVPEDQVNAIRDILTQDLKTRGVALAGASSANTIRLTFSQSAQERLWVAEVMQGTESRVAIVDLGPVTPQPQSPTETLVLRKQLMLTSASPIVAALAIGNDLIALGPQRLAFYTRGSEGWLEQQRIAIDTHMPIPRDPRGVLAINGADVEAWVPGAHCVATSPAAPPGSAWSVDCHGSDDPWMIANTPPLHAFYNPARNYFTGVLVPDSMSALPPFYSLTALPAEGGYSLLVGSIDGKVQIVSNVALHTLAGTRDWGSDFAALQSGCGTGSQVIAAGSVDTLSDSLRAYQVQTDEAQPASAPLDIVGTVTALMSAPDGKSAIAVVRNQNTYEVDRVTALCN